jgi:hypothetical protein
MLFDTLFDLVNESHRPLYHATSLGSALRIINNNVFQLTFSGGTTADNTHGRKMFYLSTSRIPNGGYTVNDYHANPNCKFELDGSLLSQNYQIKPVDYWGATRSSKYRSADENEDRIWSHRPTIKNAAKYIVALHVFVPKKEDPMHKMVHDLIEYSKQGKVPVIFYDNLNAYKLVDKRRAIQPEDPNSVEYNIPYKSNYMTRSIEDLRKTYEWLKDPTPNDFWHKRAHSFDFDSVVSSDVHNMRSAKTQEAQDVLYDIARLMRKTNSKSIKQLVKKAQDKAVEIYRNSQN